KLRYVGILATGTNIVDLAAARESGIVVSNVPAYGTSSVAQTTLALLLELTQHVGLHSDGVHQGRWTSNPDWCYWERPLIELHGLPLAFRGSGRFDTDVARIGSGLGFKLFPPGRASPGDTVTTKNSLPGPAMKRVDLEALFRQSDVVSLHCPLTPETKHLINA